MLQGSALRSALVESDGSTNPDVPAALASAGPDGSGVPYVPDSPPSENKLLMMPDGPLRHNKALYDAGHEAVRSCRACVGQCLCMRCSAAVRSAYRGVAQLTCWRSCLQHASQCLLLNQLHVSAGRDSS